MKLRIFPGFLLLGLTANVAVAATLPARAPGLWQSTTTVTGADGQPLPNAANVMTVSCVDPATDLKFFESGGSNCSSLTVNGAGGTYTIDGTCAQGAKPVAIHETLTYADAKDVKLTAAVKTDVGPMTVTSELQWQGECLAGMVPGDEGQIADGAFNKTDNINDTVNR